MKIGRNEPCPCGSGKKYKKCCLNKDSVLPLPINSSILSQIPSSFDYISSTADDISKVIAKYEYRDVIIAVFCLNLWRKNRSALAQSLSLNMALASDVPFGTLPIKQYSELESFYNEISGHLKITYREDYTIDDFGEVFINHKGESYPVITGTGHQQVYGALRYMQTLASLRNRDAELISILNYQRIIINFTKECNEANINEEILFELPSADFWESVNALFENEQFQSQVLSVSKILGYDFRPIEMQHFVVKDSRVYPLFNSSILIDYYKMLLLSSDQYEKERHITQTVHSLLENTFNFSSGVHDRVIINPQIIDKRLNKQIISEGIWFAGLWSDTILLAIDSRYQRKNYIERINEIKQSDQLCIVEPYYRNELSGSVGVDVKSCIEIVYLIIDPFTDVTDYSTWLESPESYSGCKCTALDLIYLLGFSKNFGEIIDFIHYEQTDKTEVFSIGGKSNLFFTWKRFNQEISSGAICYNFLAVDYNETESFVYSYFADKVYNFPRNNSSIFADPLNWAIEDSDSEYAHVIHKGCPGFGGDIKRICDKMWVFFAHNLEFFKEEDFDQISNTVLNVIDELNQRLFVRYSEYLSLFDILSGKTLQLLFMPWNYAKAKYSRGFLCDLSRSIVFSDERIETDSVIIRYTTNPKILLNAIQESGNRQAENTYFRELLKPLRKYSPTEYKKLESKLLEDSELKKTVGVFCVEQHYYFSDNKVNTNISPISFAKAKKEIAKICFDAGIEPGMFHGKNATRTIRKMQVSAVKEFENHIAKFDMYDLHNKALNYYSIQQHEININLKRYSSFADLDECTLEEFKYNTRKERENFRRNAETAKYLLESNLVISHVENAEKCSYADFEYLLAFSDWLVVLQDAADTCHHTDFDLSISVDTEYKIDTVLSDSSHQKYDKLLERKYSTEDYRIKDDNIDKSFLQKAKNAFKRDVGIDFELIIALIEYMQLAIIQDNIAVEIYPNVFAVEKSILASCFISYIDVDNYNIAEICSAIDFLTLNQSLLKTLNGTQHELLPIWEREGRDVRFSVKPIIMKNNTCIYSPVSMNNLLTSWISGVVEWYLPYEVNLPTTKAVLTQWKKRYEDEMVKDIATLFRNAGFNVSEIEVDLAHRFPHEDYPDDLGDYDVIAINKYTHKVWIIESKVLQKVGSIYEDQMQQKSFFYQHKDDEKFQRRIDYFIQNQAKILLSFKIDDEKNEFQIVPYMVTNKLFLSRYKEIEFPIVTFNELARIINQE